MELFQTNAAGAPWTISITNPNGAVRIAKPADNDSLTTHLSVNAGMRCKLTFEGDFSMFVDFDLNTFHWR